MDTVVFGRTGLEVSVVGLGCGGHSRLGQSYGASRRTTRSAWCAARIDLGITYIDTAQAYGTEEIVGEGGRAVAATTSCISTKVSPQLHSATACCSTATCCGDAVHDVAAASSDTDWIDVYHLHGVGDDEYATCVAELVPELRTRCVTKALIRYPRDLRAVRGRSGARDAAARRRGRLLGRDDGRVQPR